MLNTPGTGVIDGYMPSCGCWEPWSSARAVIAVNSLISPTPPCFCKSGPKLFFHSLSHHYVNCLIYLVCFMAQQARHSHTCRDSSSVASHRKLTHAGSSGSPTASWQTPHPGAVYTARQVARADCPPHNSSCLYTIVHISPNR